MAEKIEVKILSVKSMTEYLLKEENSDESENLKRLELLMSKTYSISDECKPREELGVGSDCVVYCSLNNKKSSPKRWFRAVIKGVYQSVGTFLYSLYLHDYGVDVYLKKQFIREMRPQFDTMFVRYQAFDYQLSGVEPQNGIKVREVVEYIKKLFKTYNDYGLAEVMTRDVNGLSTGRLTLPNGMDVGSHLAEKSFAVIRYSLKSDEISIHTDVDISDNISIRKPISPPFIRSPNNALVVNPKVFQSQPKGVVRSDETIPPIDITRDVYKNVSNIFTNNIENIDESNTVRPNTVESNTVRPNTVHSNTVQSNTVHSNTVQSNTVHSNTVRPNTVQSNTVHSNNENSNNCLKNDIPKRPIRRNITELLAKIRANESKQKSISNGLKKLIVNKDEYEKEVIIRNSVSEPKNDSQFDWPEFEARNDFTQLRPAGCQPPPEVLERIFTLKKQNEY